mmetsp:Transcript_24174/g.83933  ORF Transcript_24174/g.83933 Transcript_24174/m.83933 type:complete len:315 (+) Transcript_24174:537-1481(+)
MTASPISSSPSARSTGDTDVRPVFIATAPASVVPGMSTAASTAEPVTASAATIASGGSGRPAAAATVAFAASTVSSVSRSRTTRRISSHSTPSLQSSTSCTPRGSRTAPSAERRRGRISSPRRATSQAAAASWRQSGTLRRIVCGGHMRPTLSAMRRWYPCRISSAASAAYASAPGKSSTRTAEPSALLCATDSSDAVTPKSRLRRSCDTSDTPPCMTTSRHSARLGMPAGSTSHRAAVWLNRVHPVRHMPCRGTCGATSVIHDAWLAMWRAVGTHTAVGTDAPLYALAPHTRMPAAPRRSHRPSGSASSTRGT